MNDLIPNATGNYKPKTFWERPEGVTGQIVGVSLIAGAGYLLYKLLPAIIAMLYVITDRRFWRLGSYLYRNMMRKITQVFVEIDPIGVMRTYVSELEKK